MLTANFFLTYKSSRYKILLHFDGINEPVIIIGINLLSAPAVAIFYTVLKIGDDFLLFIQNVSLFAHLRWLTQQMKSQ